MCQQARRVNPGLSQNSEVSISRASAEARLLRERDLACLLAKYALQHTVVLENGPSEKGSALDVKSRFRQQGILAL
jgi:hypothetical protein